MADYTLSYAGSQLDDAVAVGLKLPSSLSGLGGNTVIVNSGETAFTTRGVDIPLDTSIVFNQAAVPTGYDSDSWSENVSLIIGPTYGSGNASGASPTSWETALIVGDHAITESEMPPHTHGDGTLATDNDTHNHSVTAKGNGTVDLGSYIAKGISTSAVYVNTANDTHNHGVTGSTGSTGDGTGHNHTLTQDTYDPKYQIMITGTRAA